MINIDEFFRETSSTTFKVLCELYSTSLKRDPNYTEYVTKIGQIYFGIVPANTNRTRTGLFGNLLHTLMDEENSEDEFPFQESAATLSHEELD